MGEDVKIYVSSKKENGDVSAMLEVMKEHRANGNIDKAKLLGKRLGEIDVDFSGIVSPKLMKPDIVYQMKVLTDFAAEVNLQMLISAPLLSTTAVNAMYDVIQEKSSGFYFNISDGMAFSFYYAAVRNGGDIPVNIGRAFAMLCSVDSNESFIKAGADIYNEAVRVVSEEINRADFSII